MPSLRLMWSPSLMGDEVRDPDMVRLWDNLGRDSQTDSETDHPKRPYKTNWYVTLVARFPYVVATFCLVLSALAGLVFLHHDLPTFDDPTEGFEARGTNISGRSLAVHHLLSGNYSWHGMLTAGIQQGRRRRSARSADNWEPLADPRDCTLIQQGPILDPSKVMKIVFTSSSRSGLFTAQTLREICQMEDEHVRKYVQYVGTDICRMHSLPLYVALLSGKQDECYNITDEDTTRVLDVLNQCAPFFHNGSLKEDCLMSPCLSVPLVCSHYNAVYKILQYLADTQFLREDNNNPPVLSYTMMIFHSPLNNSKGYYQEAFDGKHLKLGSTEIKGIYQSMYMKFSLFQDYLIYDFRYFAVAALLICFVIVTYLCDIFLMVATLINVGASFLMAYTIYTAILDISFFPFINSLGLLILIAIGADDVFIFYDTWRQIQAREKDAGVPEILEKTFRHAALSIFVTSLTTSAAFFANYISDITAVQCFGVFAGVAVLTNFLFMVTWTPSVIVFLYRIEQYCKRTACYKTLPRCWILQVFKEYAGRFSEHVFSKTMPLVLTHGWWGCLLLLAATGAGGMVMVLWKPGLKLPSSTEFQLFRENQPMEYFDMHLRDKFQFLIDEAEAQKEEIQIFFVWGLLPEDNGNHLDPDDHGTLVKDPNFNFTLTPLQPWFLAFCSDLKKQDFIDVKMRNTTPVLLNLAFDSDDNIVSVVVPIKTVYHMSASYEVMRGYYATISNFTDSWMNSAPAGMNKGFFTTIDYFKFYDLQRAISLGTFYSIALSLGVAFAVMLLTTLNLLLTIYALFTISLAIASTVGCLVLLGWTLNIVESVTISLAVGLSIDFTIHYGVAYRLASRKKRQERMRESLKSVGPAVLMAALTTFLAGSAVMPSHVLAYLRLGTFLMLVMTFSWIYATFFFLAICRIMGPNGNFCQIPVPCGKKTSDIGDYDLDSDTAELADTSGCTCCSCLPCRRRTPMTRYHLLEEDELLMDDDLYPTCEDYINENEDEDMIQSDLDGDPNEDVMIQA